MRGGRTGVDILPEGKKMLHVLTSKTRGENKHGVHKNLQCVNYNILQYVTMYYDILQ